jgi:SAM-dependent methyltransferase
MGKGLDIGCGRNKSAGCVGMDRVALDGVDVVHDVNVAPWPFPDNEFSLVRMSHVIEHCDSILVTMEEAHRVLRDGGIVEIVTPHYTDPVSWQDVTHKWHLNSRSFDYFDPGYHTNYYTKARFEIVDSYIQVSNLFKPLGAEFLVNLERKHRFWRFFRKQWELYLCFLVRGKSMSFKLKAIKPAA